MTLEEYIYSPSRLWNSVEYKLLKNYPLLPQTLFLVTSILIGGGYVLGIQSIQEKDLQHIMGCYLQSSVLQFHFHQC